MRRVACVALPEIRVEIAREREDRQRAAHARTATQGDGFSHVATARCGSVPLAVVVARPGGAVKTERDVLGNTRLDVVSREARALGVRAGQTVAAARAKCSELLVRVVAEAAVRAALERIAETALGFGPTVALDVAQDLVWVEIGGCAHLHGGERELAQAFEARVVSLGHACRVAIAEGPRIAAAIARFAPLRDNAKGDASVVVPQGKGAVALRVLPIVALALDDDVTSWLDGLGLRTCGDLQKLPYRSLGTRLGARAHDVMQLLRGEDPAPLDAWRPPEVPEERVELEWGVSSLDALLFVAKTLCDRLAGRLEGRAMAATRIELEFSLDRALCRTRVQDGPHVWKLDVALQAPLVRAADLLAVLRARLEHLDGRRPVELAAPVLAATLRAPELARATARPLDFLEPEPKADRALPRLVAELAADIGVANVGTLALVDTWVPEERTCLVSFESATIAAQRRTLITSAVERHALITSAIEPSRLLPPRRVAKESLADAELLARVEAIEWWSRDCPARDFLLQWFADPGSLGWIELVSAHGDAWLRGWLD